MSQNTLWQRFNEIAVSILGKVWRGFQGSPSCEILEANRESIRRDIFDEVCSEVAKQLGWNPTDAAHNLAQVFYGALGNLQEQIQQAFPAVNEDWFQENCLSIFMNSKNCSFARG